MNNTQKEIERERVIHRLTWHTITVRLNKVSSSTSNVMCTMRITILTAPNFGKIPKNLPRSTMICTDGIAIHYSMTVENAKMTLSFVVDMLLHYSCRSLLSLSISFLIRSQQFWLFRFAFYFCFIRKLSHSTLRNPVLAKAYCYGFNFVSTQRI